MQRLRILSFAERVGRVAERLGNKPFLTLIEREGERALSYVELLAGAKDWSARYAAAGLEPGARVVVILEHGAALYAAYLGALLGGFCPAAYAHPSSKVDDARYGAMVQALLERTGCDALVTSRAIRPRLGAAPGVACLLDDGSATEGRRRAPRRPAEDALFLQFSSGTTGLKKGVAVSAAALLWQVDAYADCLQVGERDVIASWLPLYHDMGLIACFFLPLLRGVPLVAMSPFEWVARPALLLDAVARHRATLAWLPNFAYNFLAARTPPDARWDLSSLRAVVNCSEPILDSSQRAFIERFAGCGLKAAALATCYALAENTFAVTSGGMVTDMREGRVLVSSGRALPQTRITIAGPEGEALPEGGLGEIVVSSPSLFSGYVGNPQDTAASLGKEGLRTGDLGYLRNGELYVIGRTKDTIILAGRNIYPQDVEALVSAVDGVVPGRCVALGVNDEQLGTQTLVILAETQLTAPEARAALRRRIHEAVVRSLDLVPADIALADPMWLVKSTSGKIARDENRNRYLEARRTAGEPHAGAGATPEAAVRACIAEALALGASRIAPPFSDEEDLVQAGILDSFALVSLQLGLDERFGAARTRLLRESPERYRSVRAMAAALREERAAPPPAAAPAAKDALVPQMRDVEAQPYEWVAYLMRRGMPNYRSPTLNSDEHGFRATWRAGRPLAYAEFMADARPKAVVLGNSFAYGIGTTHDAKTFTSLLNGADLLWYNMAQRASVTLQERLACELYGPATPRALAWVSGVNNLISLIVGEGAPGNPAPFVGERQYALRMMPGVRFAAHAPFEERFRLMLRQLETDISALALRLRGAKLGFFLQPSASWVEKDFTAEERSLIERFDSTGAVLQQAHHPQHLGPLHRRFAGDLAAICGRWGVDFVDSNADARLRRAAWLFVDRTHMTDAGHAVMAEIIADWLK